MSESFPSLKFSAQNSSTKEKIIYLLSENLSLSLKDLFEKLKKEYSIEVSHQAVHKILLELEQEKVIEKIGREWKIQKDWLLKGKQFFQKSLEKYSGSINRYDIKLGFEGIQIFKFDNYTDLSVKTAELLTNNILVKNSNNSFICIFEYGWWPFKFRFEHFKLIYKMIANCPKSKNIIRKDTPFGRWIRTQYIKIKGISAPIGKNIEINEDLYIQGDYIIEVTISPEGKKIIEKYWNKWENIDDTLKDFGLKEEPKIESTVKITKNPELANFMKKELEKYFQ